jgi:hypothetical protein
MYETPYFDKYVQGFKKRPVTVKTDVTNRFSHCPLPFLQVLKV